MKALLLALVTVAMLTLTSPALAGHRCRVQPRRVYRPQPQVQLYYGHRGWGVGVRLNDDYHYPSYRSYWRYDHHYDYRRGGHHGYRGHRGHH